MVHVMIHCSSEEVDDDQADADRRRGDTVQPQPMPAAISKIGADRDGATREIVGHLQLRRGTVDGERPRVTQHDQTPFR
jgi:hypothetical protein